MLTRLVALAIISSAPSADAGGPAGEINRRGRPAAAVRVSEADPQRLGVHAAISVPGVPEEIPPKYVPPDVDAAEQILRARADADDQYASRLLSGLLAEHGDLAGLRAWADAAGLLVGFFARRTDPA